MDSEGLPLFFWTLPNHTGFRSASLKIIIWLHPPPHNIQLRGSVITKHWNQSWDKQSVQITIRWWLSNFAAGPSKSQFLFFRFSFHLLFLLPIKVHVHCWEPKGAVACSSYGTFQYAIHTFRSFRTSSSNHHQSRYVLNLSGVQSYLLKQDWISGVQSIQNLASKSFDSTPGTWFFKRPIAAPGTQGWFFGWSSSGNPAPVDISVVKRCSTSHFVVWMDHPNLVVHRSSLSSLARIRVDSAVVESKSPFTVPPNVVPPPVPTCYNPL